MVKTRASSSTAQQPELPAAAPAMGMGRGRVRGRGRGRAQPQVAVPEVEPHIDFDEEYPAPATSMGPAQVPGWVMFSPNLQDALVRISGFMDSVTRAGLLLVAPSTSQAGGGVQTPATRTPEQVAPRTQVPVVQPTVAAHTGITAQAGDGAAMSSDALWRLDRFSKIITTTFSGTSSEDPQDFLFSCHEILRTMGIVETNGVDFCTFRLAGSAKTWWRDYCLSRPAGSPALTWDQFAELFLEKFLPVTQREALRRQFERLHQGSMIVTQYETRFIDLARYEVVILPTERERVRRLIDGLILPIRLQMAMGVGSDISFQEAANTARQVEMALFRGGSQGSDKSPRHSGGGGPQQYYSDQQTFSAPPAPISAPPLQSFRGGHTGRQGQQSQQPRAAGDPQAAHPARGGGRDHRGGGRDRRGGARTARGRGQPAADRPKDTVQGGGGQPRCYALPARLEPESSDVVITGTILVCGRGASVLFDPGSTYSYVSSYFAPYLIMPSEALGIPVYLSILVGESIVVDRVHRSCVVVFDSLETRVDLLLLDMVYFDAILGMDWLSPYHAILDCHAKTVTLALPDLPRLEWRGTPGHATRSVISYVKARRMVEKGCLAYLAYVRDSSAEVPSIDSVPIVREFPEVFPSDLPGMPPDRDIDLCIDLASGTQPNSILPYRMAPPELKELKEQLQDLLSGDRIHATIGRAAIE
ncbi:uncharacterized protein [Nicotiana sylvestris]|uniref:uncharacterized protein n=1 Tax=Nicotiana sylvestris TaxID=4096 RepID=UPI00388CA286